MKTISIISQLENIFLTSENIFRKHLTKENNYDIIQKTKTKLLYLLYLYFMKEKIITSMSG